MSDISKCINAYKVHTFMRLLEEIQFVRISVHIVEVVGVDLS